MKNYYIIDDVWNVIKTYLFHNIKKQGIHLQNRKHVLLYNKVVKSIPTIVKPCTGPYVVYSPPNNNIRLAKLLYYNVQLRLSRRRPLFNSIVEYVLVDSFIPKRLVLFPHYESKSNVLKYYHENVQNVKSKLT
tara:strand:- start:433 stop:831 length:399 start_codon:yes stop_codon:yes gene_type:complete